MGSELIQLIKRSFKWMFLLCVFGFVSILMISSFVVDEMKGSLYTIETIGDFDADCVLILGAGVSANNTPSAMLQDRLDKGIEISKNDIEKKLLMSGDHGTLDYDEVNVMKSVAIKAGLNSSDIFMDHAGFSTYESLIRARDVFGVKKVIIVSQKEHLYRALYIARGLGLEAIGVAAEPKVYGGQFARDVRETLARVKDVFTVLIKPLPSYLGDSIPITGDGDITNDK
jgi:SanA protein